MWRSISKSISSFGPKKSAIELGRACQDSSDDETCSNASVEEGLECPICWESFNIVENVPYILWCGHILCKNCVLGLRWAALKFYTQQIQIPLFVSCPWCNLWTFRLIYGGNLKFPSENFFLLWMVESRNGDRVQSASLVHGESQQRWSSRRTSVVGNYTLNDSHRRTHCLGHLGSRDNDHNCNNIGILTPERQLSLHKSIDIFIRMTAKFPLLILLLVVIFALPASATILFMYFTITVLFAVPAFLVLYFAYTALDWLGREIQS